MQILRQTFETNFFGVFAVTQSLLPLLRESSAGRIVNLSSSVGSLTSILDTSSPLSQVVSPAYQASKTAVNALTVLFAKELADTNLKSIQPVLDPLKQIKTQREEFFRLKKVLTHLFGSPHFLQMALAVVSLTPGSKFLGSLAILIIT